MSKMETFLAEQLKKDGDPIAHLEALGISLAQQPVLKPGLDFKNGDFYYTTLVNKTVEVTVGKGKNAKTENRVQPSLLVLRARRDNETTTEYFDYDWTALQDRGFVPADCVSIPTVRNWSQDSLTNYLRATDEPVDSLALFNEVRSITRNYIEFEADERLYDITALFLMFSYLYRVFRATPYFHFTGTAGSGKTQTLRILKALGFNATHTGSITESALFRTVAGNPGLVCVDEAEGWQSEREQAVRSLLLSGYSDSSTAKRTEKNAAGMFVTVEYDTFAPKAIASINPLDSTLASRCFIVPMRPALRPIENFRADDPRWQPTRDRLFTWALQNATSIGDLREDWQGNVAERVGPWLANRPWEISEPLVVLADYIDTGLKDRIVAWLQEYFEQQKAQQQATDATATVLRILPRVLAKHVPWSGVYYKTHDILDVLKEYLDEDQRDKWTSNRLGRTLTTLGFNDRKRMQGGTYVALHNEEVKTTLRNRRIDPYEEDRAWFEDPNANRQSMPAEDKTSFDLLGEAIDDLDSTN